MVLHDTGTPGISTEIYSEDGYYNLSGSSVVDLCLVMTFLIAM